MSPASPSPQRLQLHPAAQLFLAPDASLIEAIKVIDAAAMQIALIVDADQRLVGVITDGDIRRAILRGVQLNDPVSSIVNRTPLVVDQTMTAYDVARLIRDKSRILRLPVIGAGGRVVGVYRAEEVANVKTDGWPVVLMAGGLGSRLRPYTDKMPKPMLDIGGRPILERIILQFMEHGCNRFYLSVNHMADIIKDHFGDGEKLGTNISYLEETERMGTAGSLRLLPPEVDTPFFVMNGDLLTATNFTMLMNYHIESGAEATMCLREYTIEVPYGVVEHSGSRLVGIQEKPKHQHFVNAGIYALNPSVLSHLPESGYYDMPSLFDSLVAQDVASAAVYPLREYWCDIGKFEDLERARRDILHHFNRAG